MALLTATRQLGISLRPGRDVAALPGLRQARVVACRAERKLSSSAGKPDDDLLLQACPVPRDQQPMQEFSALENSFLFDWARLPLPEFGLRLLGVFAGFFLLVGLPISTLTFSVQDELVQLIASSSIGSGFITLLLVLRLYLGYSHVSSRLLSATVEYEETGWYDGQIWVKTPQMLMRDRLLGTYQVKPTLDKCKRALLGLSGAMAAATVLLAAGPPPKAYSSEAYMPTGGSEVASLDYSARVAAYEPWGQDADEEEGQEDQLAGRPSMLDHMQAPSRQG